MRISIPEKARIVRQRQWKWRGLNWTVKNNYEEDDCAG